MTLAGVVAGPAPRKSELPVRKHREGRGQESGTSQRETVRVPSHAVLGEHDDSDANGHRSRARCARAVGRKGKVDWLKVVARIFADNWIAARIAQRGYRLVMQRDGKPRLVRQGCCCLGKRLRLPRRGSRHDAARRQLRCLRESPFDLELGKFRPATAAPPWCSRTAAISSFTLPPQGALEDRALPPPSPLKPFSSSPAVAGERLWHPAGTVCRRSGCHLRDALAPTRGRAWWRGWRGWTRLVLRAALYRSLSPGPGPWKVTAPISLSAARTLVAAFNGGFKFPESQGGYYSEGRFVYPLRTGGASLVVYANGDATVGQWGRDVTMTSQVIAVRQNLTLLVDNSRPVPGLHPYDASTWGSTLGGIPEVWRSGLGVTANGALVLVRGLA